MRLLFDHNLCHRIVPQLSDLFECAHVRQFGLQRETSDERIWTFARDEAFTVVTADADFVQLANRYGPPPKVIRLERMNNPTRTAAQLLRRHAVAITEFASSAQSVLVLRNE